MLFFACSNNAFAQFFLWLLFVFCFFQCVCIIKCEAINLDFFSVFSLLNIALIPYFFVNSFGDNFSFDLERYNRFR